MRARGVSHLLSASVVRAVGQGVATLIVAAVLGASEWGKAAALLVVANLATQLTASGVYAAVFTEGQYAGRERRPGWSDVVGGSTLAAAATTAAGMTVGLALSLSMTGGVAAGALSLGAALLHSTRADALLAERPELAARATTFRPVLTVLGAGSLWLLDYANAGDWLVVVTLASLADAALIVRFRRRHRMPSLAVGSLGVLRVVLWLGLGTLGTALLRTTDQLMLARWADFASVGKYALAARGVDMAVMIIAAVVQSRHALLGSQASDARLVAASHRLAFVAAGIGGVLIMPASVGGFWLDSLLGKDYAGIGWVFLVLAASLPARGAFLVFEFGALLRGRVIQRNVAVWSSFAANAAMNVVLIPWIGVLGAAIATLMSESLATVVLWWRTGRSPCSRKSKSHQD